MNINFLPAGTHVRHVRPDPVAAPGMTALQSVPYGTKGVVKGHGIMSTGQPYYRIQWQGWTVPHTAVNPLDIEPIY